MEKRTNVLTDVFNNFKHENNLAAKKSFLYKTNGYFDGFIGNFSKSSKA